MKVDRWAAQTWRPFGKSDPYYGVCSDERFRMHLMDDATRRAFFASGEDHVASVLADIRAHIAPGFAPGRTVDFGSGVGRLLIPLARASGEAVGVDISPEMIAEAERNCAAEGVRNATFVLSDDRLSRLPGKFDLVHSFIVLQHIPPARGERIIEALLDRMTPEGVAALHVTYGRSAPTSRKIVHRLRRTVPLVNALTNAVQGRPLSEPLIPMYEYRMDRLLAVLHRRGHMRIHVTLTNHGGHLGAMLLVGAPAVDAR